MTPIYATSTYVQESPGVHKGFEYSRSQNPTRFAYERCVAALEGRHARLCVRVGPCGDRDDARMLDSGDHVIAATIMYGGTFRLFERVAGARRADVQLRRHDGPGDDPCGGDAADAADLGGNAHQSDAEAGRPARVAEIGRRSARSPLLTTRLRARTSSGRSSSASTSSCIRRRSISMATRTSSAASSVAGDDTDVRPARVSAECGRARSRVRSIRSWRFAA